MNEELEIAGQPVELTKQTMATFAQQVKDAVVAGELDGLKALIHLKYMEKVAKEAYSKITEQAIESAEKHEGGKGVVDGAKFQVKPTGRNYYDHIHEWVNKKAEMKRIEEEAKQALEMKEKGMEMVREETGEIVTPAEYRPGAPSVAITF